jgi:RNA polymerase sigma factor (sigma-70 family)
MDLGPRSKDFGAKRFLDVVQDARVSPELTIEHLYREEGATLWRALASYTGMPEVASDALAEAFAQALRRGHDLTHPSAWIWRAAFRIAAGEMKRQRSETGLTEEASTEPPEHLQELVEALRSISPNQRLAVILHDYADRPITDVCEVMGIARATVYVHLSQGRHRLRKLLQEEDDA